MILYICYGEITDMLRTADLNVARCVHISQRVSAVSHGGRDLIIHARDPNSSRHM